MAGNTYGTLFKLTTFGESHGNAIGGVIDGCPPGIIIDFEFIQHQLDRRKPGQSGIVSPRKEKDKVIFLSGIFDGRTIGTPIAFMVHNEDHQSKDYDNLKDTFRPSHADYTYTAKYGHKDHRGSGRASARETLSRVVAGAVAQLYLKQHQISFCAYVSQIGNIKLDEGLHPLNFEDIESNLVRCPNKEIAFKMIQLIENTALTGDTLGGIITCKINGVPVGLGEPVFDKLHAELGKAMLSINAVKGFEFGSGFKSATMKGSEHNDLMVNNENKIEFLTNHSGGIQGGISNGAEINFNVAFKPVSSIKIEQKTLNKDLNEVSLKVSGRHDVCVVPRAVPIVEAMAALVIIDFLLRQKCNN
ncbi:MAG TPA: chorismate synthase [Bacteroidia bacterium]|nr:chorismate synthase [Bacteroidia bacterium]